MPGKSDYLESGILNHVFRAVAFPTIPAAVFISLHTADPLDAGTGAEVSTTGTAYARASVTRAVGAFAAPTDNAGSQQTSNSAAITYATATANWGTVTHVGVQDAVTAGNLLYSAALTTSRTINNGDVTPSFAIGALTVQES